jgi:hypothetical protein
VGASLTIFELSSVTSSWSESSLKSSTAFKDSQENAGKASVSVAPLPGAKRAKLLGESDRVRKPCNTSTTACDRAATELQQRKLYDTSTTACNRAATELQQRKIYDMSTTACNRAAIELQQWKLYDTSTTACNRARTELQQRKIYDTSTTALAGKTESKAEKAFQGPFKRQDESLRVSLKTPFQDL